MNAAAARGEIEQGVVDEFNDASRGKTKHLPQKVKPKSKIGKWVAKNKA